MMLNFITRKSNSKLPYDFVLGYRMWKVRNNHLTSVAETTTWLPNSSLTGQCNLGENHRVPIKTCRCGVHALNSLLELKDYEKQYFQTMEYFISKDGRLSDYVREYQNDNTVSGVILAWGKISFYEHGFRAEYAKPLALIKGKAQSNSMSEVYNIPNLSEVQLNTYLSDLSRQNKFFVPKALAVRGFKRIISGKPYEIKKSKVNTLALK